MERWWKDSDRGIPNYWREVCPIATLSTIHLTQTGLISKMAPHRQRMETNRQSLDTASETFLISEQIFSLRIHRCLCNTAFYFHVHNSLSLIPVRSLVKSCSPLSFHSSKIRFNIILIDTPSFFMFQGFRTKICMHFSPILFPNYIFFTYDFLPRRQPLYYEGQ